MIDVQSDSCKLRVLGHVQIVTQGDDEPTSVEVGENAYKQCSRPVQELSTHRWSTPALAKVKLVTIIQAFHHYHARIRIKYSVVQKVQVRKFLVQAGYMLLVSNRNDSGCLERSQVQAL